MMPSPADRALAAAAHLCDRIRCDRILIGALAGFVSIATIPFTGCDRDVVPPPPCLAPCGPAILVEVRDAITGEPAAADTDGRLIEGTATFPLAPSADSGGLTLFGGECRAGTYDVVIDKAGYETWTASDVQVTMDGVESCPRVETVTLAAHLERTP